MRCGKPTTVKVTVVATPRPTAPIMTGAQPGVHVAVKRQEEKTQRLRDALAAEIAGLVESEGNLGEMSAAQINQLDRELSESLRERKEGAERTVIELTNRIASLRQRQAALQAQFRALEQTDF